MMRTTWSRSMRAGAVTAVLALSLAACGSDDVETEDPGGTTAESVATTETPETVTTPTDGTSPTEGTLPTESPTEGTLPTESTTEGTLPTESATQGGAPGSTDLANLTPGSPVDVNTLMTASAEGQKNVKTAKMDMTMKMGSMEMKYDGVMQRDPLQMQMTMNLGGQNVEMVLADSTMYMKMPAGLGGDASGKWMKVDSSDPSMASLNQVQEQMNDPLANWGGAEGVKSATFVGEEDVDGEKMRHFTLLIDGKAIAEGAAQPGAPAMGDMADIPAEFWLDSENRTRKMTMKMEMPKTTATGMPDLGAIEISMLMSGINEPVTITVPDPSQVVAGPGSAPTTP